MSRMPNVMDSAPRHRAARRPCLGGAAARARPTKRGARDVVHGRDLLAIRRGARARAARPRTPRPPAPADRARAREGDAQRRAPRAAERAPPRAPLSPPPPAAAAAARSPQMLETYAERRGRACSDAVEPELGTVAAVPGAESACLPLFCVFDGR